MRRRRKHYASLKAPHSVTGTPALDGVQLAILNKRFEGVCRKMANTLFRTGRSGVLNTARDFSCCIVTANNQLLTSAEMPANSAGRALLGRKRFDHHFMVDL